MTEKNYQRDNKSFMMYKDWEQLFLALESDEKIGQLLKALFAFAKRGEVPELEGTVKMAFLVMSQQIERDGLKWEETCRKNTVNGSKGGRPKKPGKPDGFSENPTKPKKPDKDTEEDADTEKDTVTDTEKETEKVKEKDINEDTEQDEDTKALLTQNQFDRLVGLSSLSSVRKYISKILDWQEKNNKSMRDPYETIKNWIEQDGRTNNVIRSENNVLEHKPSYDLDEWERFAVDFDPTEYISNKQNL